MYTKMPLQLQQLFTLFVILVLGKYAANVYLPWKSILLVLMATVAIEHLLIYAKERSVTYFSFSSLSTAIGVMLMLATPHLWIVVLVIALGLIQKYYLKMREKHFFNPSNFSIMVVLLFFYDSAHLILGQLGDSMWMKGIVSLLAVAILVRVERWLIPLVFVISYLLSQYFIVLQHDPMILLEDVYHRFYAVSFIVFILFMLTDPRTTPKTFKMQIFFAVGVALFSTLLDYQYGFRVQHIFLSLFLVTPLVFFLTNYQEMQYVKYFKIIGLAVVFLSLSAIIYIETKPPYHYEMSR